ncbi:unnamed protein product [Bathycoccus prasinos]
MRLMTTSYSSVRPGRYSTLLHFCSITAFSKGIIPPAINHSTKDESIDGKFKSYTKQTSKKRSTSLL